MIHISCAMASGLDLSIFLNPSSLLLELSFIHGSSGDLSFLSQPGSSFIPSSILFRRSHTAMPPSCLPHPSLRAFPAQSSRKISPGEGKLLESGTVAFRDPFPRTFTQSLWHIISLKYTLLTCMITLISSAKHNYHRGEKQSSYLGEKMTSCILKL